jgi:hypothetical protein
VGAADRIADVILRQGEIAGRGAQNTGAIWGGALQNLGQTVAALPTYVQNQRMREQEVAMRGQEMQMRDQQMQQLQRAQASQDAANKVVASFPRRADGTYDVGGMIQQMSGSGVHPADVEHYGSTFEKLNQLSTAAVEAQRQHQARAADIILSGAQGQEITPEDVHVALATLKTLPGGLVNDEDEQAWTQAFAAGQDPRKFLESVSRAGRAPEKAPTNDAELAYLAAGGSQRAKTALDLAKPPKAAGGITNEIELRQDAATKDTSAETPTAWQSVETLRQMDEAKAAAAGVKPPTAEEDKAKAVTIRAKMKAGAPVTADEKNWLSAHEDEATMTTDRSAANALDRQNRTIQAQIDQQARAQGFTEKQAVGKEYVEKYSQPYQTALASSQTLRDTVQAAKGGNMVAANLQNLETAMAAIRAQGLNRINTTEIGVAANAGSLWDRVQAAAGKVSKGQPVDPALQADILKFADILDKAATLKYQKGREGLMKTYPGVQVPDESAAAQSAATPARKVGDTITYQGRQRKVVKVYPDGSVDLAK